MERLGRGRVGRGWRRWEGDENTDFYCNNTMKNRLQLSDREHGKYFYKKSKQRTNFKRLLLVYI